MPVHSRPYSLSNHTSHPTKPRATKNKMITDIDYIPCSQINLHRSEIPTAQFYYSVESTDDMPYIAFVQEPYCVRGKPKHLPGNGVTLYHTTSDGINPRATLTISNNLADQFFFQLQFSDRDTATCSIELPNSKLYVSSIYMDGNSQGPPETFLKLAEHCLRYKHGLIIGTDSNSHHSAWGNRASDNRGNKLLECLAQAGLLWLNNGKHTWRRNEQFTAIDLTLRNEFAPEIIDWDTNPDFSLSDHVLIEFTISLNKDAIKVRPTRNYNKKRCDWNAYKAAVKEKMKTFSKFTNKSYRNLHKQSLYDLNTQINKLNDILHDCFVKSCPPTFIRNRKRFTWWSKGITEAETELINSRLEHETDPHNIELQSRYNESS